MTTKRTIRMARGTLPPPLAVAPEGTVATVAVTDDMLLAVTGDLPVAVTDDMVVAVDDVPVARRMTMRPPRFTTTTPGVLMRRMPR